MVSPTEEDYEAMERKKGKKEIIKSERRKARKKANKGKSKRELEEKQKAKRAAREERKARKEERRKKKLARKEERKRKRAKREIGSQYDAGVDYYENVAQNQKEKVDNTRLQIKTQQNNIIEINDFKKSIKVPTHELKISTDIEDKENEYMDLNKNYYLKENEKLDLEEDER